MKDYVFYISHAPGNMGGRWEEERKVIACADNDAAREEMRRINANWASVIACFPAECEITLRDNKPTIDPDKPTVIRILKDCVARMDDGISYLSFRNVSFSDAPKMLNIQGDLKNGVPISAGTLFTVSYADASWLTNNDHEAIEIVEEAKQ